tara:strand:+ start:347 stop:2104 length:1758 start_codon:yes stop_codon:yes gene_type:complete
MAINLLGKADTGLVTAATRAGLASAPKDYSKTFESVSKNYHNTMMASAKMWGDIAKAGTSMYMTYKAGQAEKNLNNPKYKGDKSRDELFQEARKLRRGAAKLAGLPEPEAKEQYADIIDRQNALYGFGEQLMNNYATLDNNMNNADPNNQQPYNMERARAMQAFMTKSGPTDLGNYIVSEKNEKGGYDLVMYHDPKHVKSGNIPLGIVSPDEIGRMTSFGKDDVYTETTSDDPSGPKERKYADLDELSGSPILGMDGEKIIINMDELNNSIIPKDENRRLQKAQDEIIKAYGSRGLNAETLNPEDLAAVGDQVDDLISNFGKQGWYTPSIYSSSGDGKSMSFYGEFVGIDNDGVARPTRISAEAFGSLGADYMSKIGVKDVKGTPKGIDVQDFQSEDNYLRLTQAMFNPGDKNYDEAQTQKIFREYKINQITDRVAANWKMSPKNPVNQQQTPPEDGGGDGYFNYTFAPKANNPGEQLQIDPTSAKKAYDNIENKTKDWSGAQGHYVKMKDKNKIPMYLRYDSRADYLQDLNDNNKLSMSKSAWEKTFGIDSDIVWNIERYIPETRVIELEGATMMTRSGNKKYD